MYSQKQYQYTLRMKSGFFIHMLPKTAEFIGYFQKWMNGTWPDKFYSVSSRNGQNYILTDPSNIEYIEVNEVE